MRFAHPVRASTTTVALALVAALSPVARAEGPVPSAATSAADVQALLDASNFNGAVSAASRLLSKGGTAAAAAAPDAERSQLYALKGEAQLKLKQYPQASDSFDKAGKAATDPAGAATDAATALLVKRSHNGAYTPKQPAADGTKPSPVDVTAPDDRKTALGYLFADEFAAAGPKLKAAKTAKTIPDLLRAADLANGLRSLELAATGSDEKTKPAVGEVAENAQGLLQTNLQTMTQRVGDIRSAANATSTSYQQQRMPTGAYVSQPVVRKAGLSSRNVSELKDIESTCQKVAPAADAFAKAVATAGAAGGGSAWDAISAGAGRTASQCEDVLSADYGNGTGTRRGR